MTSSEAGARQQLRRLLALLLLVAVGAFLMSSGTPYEKIRLLIDRAESVVAQHSAGAAAMFVALSALSAMLAFLSTAVVVPVAIGAWGKAATFGLLWAGWMLGGFLSYFTGRYLGRPVVRWLASDESLQRFEQYAGRTLSLPRLALVQFALPSEIPGYVLGTLRYPLRKYLLILSLTELPFALGAVLLGDRFLARDYVWFAIIAIAGLVATAIAGVVMHRDGPHSDACPSSQAHGWHGA